MIRNSERGFWQYGTKASQGGDGIIIGFDGERVAGGVFNDNCVRGDLSLAGLMNSSGCGSHAASYDEHPGYDYRAAYGTPVHAAAAGRVVAIGGESCVKTNISGRCGDWGYIGIDHGNGYITQYGHLSQIWLKPGELVNAGQLIGLSGHTAPTKLGDHLHFEVLKIVGKNYYVVDPYGWSGPGRDPLYSAVAVPPVYLWKQRP